VALVIVFDLQPVHSLDDDWGYWYSVRELSMGHGLRWFPTDSAIHLVQTLWATAVTLGHPDPVLLRLSAIPFLLAACAALWLIARDLGASSFWSATAVAALVCSPLFATVAVTFMTDVFYVALLLVSLWLALRWMDGRGSPWPAAAALILAALQRQHGVLLIADLVVVLVVVHRRRGASRADLIAAALVVVADGAGLLAPYALGTATEIMRSRGSSLASLGPSQVTTPLLVAPAMLGFFAIPFLPAVGAGRAWDWRWRVLLTAVLVAGSMLLVQGSIVTQGAWQVKWSLGGVGPWTYGGPKHVLPGFHTYFRWRDLLLPVAVAVYVWHARPWPFEGGAGQVLLGIAALSQLAPMAQTNPLDRYWIVVAAPALPVLAARATVVSLPVLSKILALVLLAGNLATWAVAEQDYLAWQVAATRVAQSVYQNVPPDEVAAGYELNMVYAVVPYYDRTGTLPHTAPGRTGLDDSISTMLFGPAGAPVRLCFANRGDPRPGQDYRSLSPGRIVWTQGDC
jgi:hypothetical protein